MSPAGWASVTRNSEKGKADSVLPKYSQLRNGTAGGRQLQEKERQIVRILHILKILSCNYHKFYLCT